MRDKPTFCLLTTSYPTFNSNALRIPRGKFVHDMARALVENGITTHVVTNHEPGEPLSFEADGVNIHRFHYFVPGWESLTGGAGIPENIRKLRNKLLVPLYFAALWREAFRLIRREDIDVINAHWAFPSGFIGLMLKQATRKKLAITAYGAELFPLQAGKLRFLGPFLRRALRQADLVVAISQATADAVWELSGRKAIVIPDGIDTHYYTPAKSDRAVMEKYGLVGKRYLFFTGRMVTRKGHRFLLDAMTSVRASHPDVILLLGGDGPHADSLLARREQLGLSAATILPGPIPEEEMVTLLRGATVFALPSCRDENGDTEGSATAALEAMSCGTPAVVSRIGGNIGGIEDGVGAWFCRAADPADLAEKLIRVLSLSPEERSAMGAKAREFVVSRYAWDRVVGRYLQSLGYSFPEREAKRA